MPRTVNKPPPRWKRLPGARPQQILAAAAKVFARDGLHSATLDAVAEEAGITKGTIYLYYKNKNELFGAALRQVTQRVLDSLRSAASGKSRGTYAKYLTNVLREVFAALSSPEGICTLRMVFSEAGRFPDVAELFYEQVILRNNREMAKLLSGGMKAGEFTKLDPMVAARALAGMVLIFVLSQKVLGGERIFPIPDSKILEIVSTLAIHGVLCKRRRRSPAPGDKT
jgi:AcrR family transcriptional regulator